MRRCLVLLAVLGPLAVSACGGAPEARRFPPDLEARAVAERYGYAVKARDWTRICTELLAPRLRDAVEQLGVACPQALATALGGVQEPTLEVVAAQIRGGDARVRVRTAAQGERPSDDVLRIVRQRDGTWRITELGA